MKNSRQRRADATKQRLMDVGIGLIEERGYDNVTIEDITSASGVSVGTFYHYFDSKDAYYYSFINSTFKQVDDSLAEHMDLPLLYNLRHYIASWFKEVDRSGADYIAHWLGHAADKEYHIRVNEVQDVSLLHVKAVETCLQGYVEKGELSQSAPISELAEIIVTLLYGIDVRYCMTNGEIDLDRWVDLISGYVEKSLDSYLNAA